MIHRTLARAHRSTRASRGLVASPDYYGLMRSLAGQSESPVIRSLGVTSSRSGEGVSTVALQCAIAAANLFRQPTLLVEANTHRPSAVRTLKLDRRPGFGELLCEREERDDCVQRLDDNLAIVTAGNLAQRSLQACDGPSIARAVDALNEGQRLTIWDLPPVGGDHLAVEIARQLDGVLLVVESERVMADIAQQAVERLQSAGVKMLGAILNKQRQHLPGWLAARL